MATGMITIPREAVQTVIMDDASGKPVNRAHGSVYISPYLYGTPRNHGNDSETGMCRIHRDAFTTEAYEWYPLPRKDGSGFWGNSFEDAIVARGNMFTYGRLYDPAIGTGNGSLLEWNNATGQVTDHGSQWDAIKPFPPLSVPHNGHTLITDGDYIYLPLDNPQPPPATGGGIFMPRVSLDTFEWELIGNPEYGYNLIPFDLYPELYSTGYDHASLIDGDLIVLARTSGTGANGVGRHTFVRIDKNTGELVDWRWIPKTTDDMTQDDRFYYLGMEVQPGTPDHWGYDWGALAIRKSDLEMFMLPKLHATDTPGTTSYASLVFGDYLIDAKTNGYVYIIDKSNPESWSLDADVNEIVLDIVFVDHALRDRPGNSWVINELHLDDDGFFVGFLWPTGLLDASYSGAVRFKVPGYNFTAAPTVNTVQPIEQPEAGRLTLRGDIVLSTGGPISDHGFYIGEDWPPSTKLSLGPGHIGLYSAEVDYNPEVPNYIQAYATNEVGEGRGLRIAIGPGLGEFEGTVTLSGEPVEGAIVTAIHSASDTVASVVTTDERGRYRFEGLITGDLYHLCVEYEDREGNQFSARSKPFSRAP